MTLVRQYQLTARPDSAGQMQAFLQELADRTSALDGCTKVEILNDASNPNEFQYNEYWISDQHRTAGGEKLGREAFAPLVALCDGKPKSLDMKVLRD